VAALAANGDGGMVTWPQGAATGDGGMVTWPSALNGDLRAGNGNGGRVCRHWPRRHVPRVAWPGGAATRRRSFLTNFFAGGLF
jgi:hypothetical protein